MAVAFFHIPDWTTSDNPGANVGSADLDNDGTPELLVLRVDRRSTGPNVGFYRVGWKLNPAGGVGNWGPWLEIPEWGSAENQGAGLAVADFGAAGLALVVLQVEHRVPGPNRGLYRVGRGLDAHGNVTAGWSNWHEVPNWISWRDQGAAVAVADLDGDHLPELIVFHVDDFHTDHPDRPNQGFYRIGHRLTSAGDIGGWGDWIPVDWFSWFNQGAGVAVADLDNNGRSEIVIFQIDNPPGENNGWYRVGWNLDQQGNVQDGWGPWSAVDGWGSWEDQGGGLALAAFAAGVRPKAVVFHVDHPVGWNAGLFAVTDLALDVDQAATKGVWRLLPYPSEVLPVHAALLHTGKVLFFAGSGNSIFRRASPDFGDEAKKVFTSVVWDVQRNTFDHPPTLRRPNGQPIDYFCCGHCFLTDGRALVIGGTDQYDKSIVNGHVMDAGHGFTGIKDALIFDPATEQWNPIKQMTRGRWYPTSVMLSGGQVVAVSGLDEGGVNGSLQQGTIELNADPDHAAWTRTRDFNLPLYSHLFLLDDGRFFFTGGKMDTPGDSDPLIFDPLTPTAAVLIDGLTDRGRCNQCASVILPPAQDQRFLILGGGPEDVDGQPRPAATHRVEMVDLRAPVPIYQARADLHHERMHVNAVLLPDRTVLATGGGISREASVRGGVVAPIAGREVLEAEIYDPAQDAWALTAKATVARLYHSVALLLPDGRVVAAGGNPDKGAQVNWLPPDPMEEMRLEIYSPPYMFKFDAQNPRPEIQNAPDKLGYGEAFTIQTPQAPQITWLSLIRPGLTTHSFNGEQRLVDVPFQIELPDKLNAHCPNDHNVAPPGWYMLFLTNRRGVPSVAQWVELS